MKCLIVGLGNPGSAYAMTRHNAGFLVVQALAKRQKWEVSANRLMQGKFAKGVLQGQHVLLLLPETYMNSSGFSVRSCLRHHEIALDRVCVVCDDVCLPYGGLRMRPFGGSGGHNGLKSVEAHLGTQQYNRLRIGVGDRFEGSLADYVLAPFSPEEMKGLPLILERACDALELWIAQGIEAAMRYVNVSRTEEIREEKRGE